MGNVHPAEEDLVMFYYRENGAPPEEMRAHLESCRDCREAYQRLVRVLDACGELPVPEPHAAFESRMWNRLEPQLQPLGRPASLASILGRWFPWNSRWLAAGAVAAMLIAAFFAGRFTRPAAGPTRIVAMTADGRQRVLELSLGDHLERSEMVLTEVANAPDQPGELAVERQRVRSLISENRLYRQTAAQANDPAVGQLLDDLERVLLDISHGTDPREIKSRIDSESLLFKLRVLGSNLNRDYSTSQKPAKDTI